jgi:hypothetical protein
LTRKWQEIHHKGEEGVEYEGVSFIFPSFCAFCAFVVKNSKRQVIKSLPAGQVEPTEVGG